MYYFKKIYYVRNKKYQESMTPLQMVLLRQFNCTDSKVLIMKTTSLFCFELRA